MSVLDKAAQFGGKVLKNCVERNSTFLFVTAAAGWVLASTAQTIGLVANKNISKEEKKFLVPQEILDGTFNILSYVAVTLPIMGAAKKAAGAKFPNNKQVAEGAKTLAAIAGGVISSNLITPVLRNKSSAIVKNKMEKQNLMPLSPEICDGKTYPNFKANNALSMESYVNFAKSTPYSGSLRI